MQKGSLETEFVFNIESITHNSASSGETGISGGMTEGHTVQ